MESAGLSAGWEADVVAGLGDVEVERAEVPKRERAARR